MAAVAAWVGAILGIVNFVIAAMARRPVFTVACSMFAGEAEAHLHVTNLGDRPLLLRNVWVWSRHWSVSPYDPVETSADRSGVKRTILHMEEGRFLKTVPANETTGIQLMGLESGHWCVVIIRWSQQRLAIPWSVCIIGRKFSRDLFDAVDPRPK